MSRRWTVVAALLALVVVAVFALSGPSVGVPKAAEVQAPQNQIVAVEPVRASPEDPVDPGRVSIQRRLSADERQWYRRRILDGLRRADDRRASPSSVEDSSPASSNEDDEHDVGDVKDRTGGELARYLPAINEDFMPLADECYAQALHRTPDLAGMLDARVEIIADETLGGLVETFDVGGDNEIEDPQMIECIRETMLSTIFAAPEAGGRDQMRLTLRFGPDEEG